MSQKDELIEAFRHFDEEALRDYGWLKIYFALKDWWPGKNMPIESYVEALGDEPPGLIMKAIEDMKDAQWRPKPNELYRKMQGLSASPLKDSDPVKDRYGQQMRPDQHLDTLARVRWLVEDEKHPVCDCMPRPVKVLEDRFHVLRCSKCDGIEQGQVYAAEDALEF